MPARQHATALVRGSSGTRATARSRNETSSMRPTPALLVGLVLCASIHARPWQLAHCRGPKQAKYSAAWLAASELLRALPESYLNTSRLFKRGTMMEAASFLLLEKTATFKTRDFLDFYVEHLSWSVHKSNIATRLCHDSIMTSTPSTRRQARRRGGVVSRRSIQPARPRHRRERTYAPDSLVDLCTGRGTSGV